MDQIHIPVEVTETEISRLKSFGASMELCASAAGYDLDKQLQAAINADKGQFSRWKNGTEGIKEDRLYAMMDYCGNDAPLLYLMYRRGYDLSSLRKRESEIERRAREAEERAARAEQELDVLRKYVGALK